MHVRQLSLAALAAAALLTGCTGEKAEPHGRGWEPDDALQRAERAMEAVLETEAEVVAFEAPFVTSGLNRTFKTPGDRPYAFTVTCDTEGIGELTLTLSRGEQEQEYVVGCRDPEADQFNIPAGGPFTARIDPVEDGTGLISWQLDIIDPDAVEGCPDDIDACDD